MTIGEIIRERRTALSLTQEQLGVKVNVSAQAVSKWETEENIPDTMTLIPLADALGISCDRLLGSDRIYEDELFVEIQRYIGQAGNYDYSEKMRRARLVQLQSHAGIFADENDGYFKRNVSAFRPDNSHSYVLTDYGFTYASNYANLPFFTCFNEPEGGFGSALKPDEKVREFFAAFADEDMTRVFFGIYSEMTAQNSFDCCALAKKFGLDERRASEIAEKLRGFDMLYAEEIDIDGKARLLYEPVYMIFPYIAVFALLYDIFRQEKGMGNMTATGRKVPFLRENTR